MSLESNAGTQYYAISCGVESLSSVDVESNAGTQYYHLSVFDYILWGQENTMVPVSSNIPTEYYFLECDVPSSSSLDLESNAGTAFYYNSAFNCVSFCD